MPPDCRTLIVERIRQSGPLTVADYMDLALYAPEVGYYARAAQRSGRAGDFVTSVDVGPVFGQLLAARFADWLGQLDDGAEAGGPPAYDLVEVAAGNGRLTRDVLDALQAGHPRVYERLAVTLVERSAAARAGQDAVLASHAERAPRSADTLPATIRGVVFANELLDAMPVHVVQMTSGGLAEVFVGVDPETGRLVERLGAPSTPALEQYFTGLGLRLEPGARADVNLAALDWIRDVAGRLACGWLVLIDYGYEAARLFGSAHATSTLRTFAHHLVDAPSQDAPSAAWLREPGSRDLTTHVDFTSVRRVAEEAGLVTVADAPQSSFLLEAALLSGIMQSLGTSDRLRDRLALKTLLVPEGFGGNFRVVVFSRRPDGRIDRTRNQAPVRLAR